MRGISGVEPRIRIEEDAGRAGVPPAVARRRRFLNRPPSFFIYARLDERCLESGVDSRQEP